MTLPLEAEQAGVEALRDGEVVDKRFESQAHAMNTATIMEHAHLVKLSKRMSKALRHDPGRIGLTLEPGGWVPVADLVAALGVERADVDTVVANNDKKRFSIVLGPDGVERIRDS